MPRPPHDLYQPEQVASLLGLPLEKVRGLQHGPYSFHSHFEFYQITLNTPKAPWGDVQIIPFRVHDRITDEVWTKLKEEVPFPGYSHDPIKTQKIFDDVHANMSLVEHRLKPAIGKVYPEHNPECDDHSIEIMPSGEWISPHTASGGLDRSKKRRKIPLPGIAWDHDWKMHIDLLHIEAAHHEPLVKAMAPHLPDNHIIYAALQSPSA